MYFGLFIIAIIMIVLGTKAGILSPTLTGIGFIVIAGLFIPMEQRVVNKNILY